MAYGQTGHQFVHLPLGIKSQTALAATAIAVEVVHGAQMGVELPQFGIKLSPVSVRYKRWGGLYKAGEQ